MEPQASFREVLNACARQLQSADYVRDGSTFRKLILPNVLVVNFQKSSTSSPVEIKFAVNLGVVIGHLIDTERVELASASIDDAHLRMRLGDSLDSMEDKWWRIDPATDHDQLAQKIVGLLKRIALPYLNSVSTTDAVRELWSSGKAPGLTNTMRERYLEELRRYSKSA